MTESLPVILVILTALLFTYSTRCGRAAADSALAVSPFGTGVDSSMATLSINSVCWATKSLMRGQTSASVRSHMHWGTEKWQ